MSRKKKSFIIRNWGYLLLVLAVIFWAVRDIGPGTALIAFALAGTWTLFAAPVWCGAEIRGGRSCRNNSYGLLGGCHLREHRWQRFKSLFKLRQFGETFRGWFTGPQNRIATCALVASGLGTLITLTQFLISLK